MSLDTNVILEAQPREERGKNAARRLRASGRVPVTIYGHGDVAAGSVVKREIAALLRAHGRNQIINLSLNGQVSPVKIAEMQLDPVKGTLIHADLMRISLTEKTEFDVPVHTKGEPEGVKLQGGVLDHVTHTLRIRCLPGDLPQTIEVDVTALKIGSHLRVRDLNLPAGLEVLTDPDVIIATVIGHKEEEVAPAPTAEVAAEPEVIRKGKQEEKE
jgi:large subunit ribosomal protein L25